jgi:hypothetical protein
MSNPTSNYNFQMPTSIDLVTDLPADFEVFGQAVDTQMKTNADAATQKATLTTTGDIYYASAASTPARRAIGTTGDVLTVSGGLPVWAAPAGGGKILQVVQGTTTTETTIASTTMTDTTITATITPTSATSTIIIMLSYSAGMYEAAGGSFTVGGRIMRGATVVYDRAAGGVGYVDHTPSNPSYKIYGGVGISGAMVYQDSPATTSATTYKLQSNISATAGGGRGVTYQGNNVVGSIILMEVAS